MMISLIVLLSLFVRTLGFTLVDSHSSCTTMNKNKLFQLQAATNNVKVTNLDNKKVIEIESGSPLSLACVRADLRLSFQCKQGHCLSCELIMVSYFQIIIIQSLTH